MSESALQLDMRIKAEQAFYDAAREGRTIEEARAAAVVAAQLVQSDYTLNKIGL